MSALGIFQKQMQTFLPDISRLQKSIARTMAMHEEINLLLSDVTIWRHLKFISNVDHSGGIENLSAESDGITMTAVNIYCFD